MKRENAFGASDTSRGARAFRRACKMLGHDPETLRNDWTSLTRAERDTLHERWRATMIADATAAGEWPVTDESSAARLATNAAKRVAAGHGTPGHVREKGRRGAWPSTRVEVLGLLPADPAQAVRVVTVAGRFASNRSPEIKLVKVIATHLRMLVREGYARRRVDHRREGDPKKPAHAYWRVAA